MTGAHCTWQDLLDRAAVQWNLARRWNVEHWQRLHMDTKQQDILSWRLRKEPLPSGIAAGMVSFVDDEDEEACLSRYYVLRGWNANGEPTLMV